MSCEAFRDLRNEAQHHQRPKRLKEAKEHKPQSLTPHPKKAAKDLKDAQCLQDPKKIPYSPRAEECLELLKPETFPGDLLERAESGIEGFLEPGLAIAWGLGFGFSGFRLRDSGLSYGLQLKTPSL